MVIFLLNWYIIPNMKIITHELKFCYEEYLKYNILYLPSCQHNNKSICYHRYKYLIFWYIYFVVSYLISTFVHVNDWSDVLS